MTRGALIAAALAAAAFLAGGVADAAVGGGPTPGGLGLREPATSIMQDIVAFHDLLLWITGAITVLVLGLLLWVIARYNRRANPTPRKFTHNIMVEVIWTIVPVMILVGIAWKSFPLLYAEERIPPAELTRGLSKKKGSPYGV